VVVKKGRLLREEGLPEERAVAAGKRVVSKKRVCLNGNVPWQEIRIENRGQGAFQGQNAASDCLSAFACTSTELSWWVDRYPLSADARSRRQVGLARMDAVVTNSSISCF